MKYLLLLFYKNIYYVDYFDQTQEYTCYDSNDNIICYESQGIVHDRSGTKIGTYTTDLRETYADRSYYNNKGRYIGSSRFLYIDGKASFRLTYFDSSKKKVGIFSKQWSLGNIVDFFLDGSQLRLIRE